jgi:large subunit ribosomal protein L4
MKINVLNKAGEDTGREVTLPESIFDMKPNDHAIYLDVKQFLANQRQGTHKSKERGEVHGSTRKLHKQKGTGGSRKGSIKNPLFRHGGRVFGPRPRDYYFKVNKKVKELARKSVLAYKAQEQKISVIEDFTFSAPKTKEYLQMLNAFSLADKKTLLVIAEHDVNLNLSSRNLKKSKVTPVSQLSTYDIMNADTLLISENSIQKLEELF